MIGNTEQLLLTFPEHEDSELQTLTKRTAAVLIENSLNVKQGDRVLILMHPTGWRLAEEIRIAALARGATIQIRYYYPEGNKILLEALSQQPPAIAPPSKIGNSYQDHLAEAYVHHGVINDQLEDLAWANKCIIIRNKITPKEDYVTDSEIQRMFAAAEAMAVRFRNDYPQERQSVLIYEPNEQEAQYAGLTLDEYRKVYYEAVDRPWPEVEKAQEFLIEYLATKKTLEITAPSPPSFPDNWNTHITMSIEGMRAANSTIKGNVPGSEVFTAPVLDSLTGTYAIPYPVQFPDRVLPNIKLVIDKGVITDIDVFYTDLNDPSRQADLNYIRKVLTTDSGSSTIGEIGIGTNPNITKAYLNTLLVEKVGGSVHLAIGNSLANRHPSITDNGNRSSVHIDLTRILLPEYGGGTISADGEVFQRDGKFIAPELSILNTQAI